MKTLFYRIGYGMVFVMFNIRVVVDLLPNTIGYLMILSALSSLRQKERSFGIGMWAAGVLAVIAIPHFFREDALNLDNPASSLNLGLILDQLEMLLQWVLMYSICAGSAKLVSYRGNQPLVSSIRFRWWFFFGSSSIVMIAYPFILNTDAIAFILFGTVAAWIALFMIMLILRQVGRELEAPFERFI
ncbi:hypothetical protein V3851_09245 [Paenibacillus sp. M1]|uniref:Uncharacterized protein n=1 Tax=Paenibacillus haidiansis TaxID=1574488 RepID=A0ABU7VRB2_9BACL